jgi:outer membrane receptor for ferrienterochelin and colicin
MKARNFSPVAGSEIPLAKVPGGVSTVSSSEISRISTDFVADALQTYVPSVTLSGLQGNVFQPSIDYRGFFASPVDGVPQGLAVYQNGVRINEAFGDTVNLDLIPTSAINGITVLSGNPVFGLNALGGSVTSSRLGCDLFSYTRRPLGRRAFRCASGESPHHRSHRLYGLHGLRKRLRR